MGNLIDKLKKMNSPQKPNIIISTNREQPIDKLIKKLELFVAESGVLSEQKLLVDEDKDLDDFDRLKKKLARDTRAIKKSIEERNLLLKKKNNVAELGIDIRQKIHDLKQNTTVLEEMYNTQKTEFEKRKEKGKKIKEGEEEQIKIRADVIDIAKKHCKECRSLEKFTKNDADNFKGYTNSEDAPASLPDIDDPQFQILIQNNNVIDGQLDVIIEQMPVVRQIVINIGTQIDVQAQRIDNITTNVDNVTAKIETLNVRLKKQLDGVRGCNRFIIDFICCVIILACIYYVYNMVHNAGYW
jgi:hypothetical protein